MSSSDCRYADQSRTYNRASSAVFLKTDAPFGGLSNMAGGYPLRVNGIRILTSEALYQACRFPHRPEVQTLIIEQKSPMTAKMKSKPYRHDSRSDWDQVRVKIMRWCLRVKLAQNWRAFSELLLATGDRPIVEESRKDDFWGAKATGDGTLVGMNVLGRLLMELREAVKADGSELLMRVQPLAIPDFLLGGRQIEAVGSEAIECDGESGTAEVAHARGETQAPTAKQPSLFEMPVVTEAPPAAYVAASQNGVRVANLKPYAEYKDSGLPWLGQLPGNWASERAKWLFTKMERPVREEDEVVTCFRDGMVTLRKNRRLRGFTEATAYSGYQGIRKGDLVIHGMDAFAGAIGVSDSDGMSTPVYIVCQPRPGVNASYYAHLVRQMSQAQWILALAKGIRERSTDFRFEMFGNQRVPIPPPDEQAAIVRFLDWANGRLEQAIRAKRKQLALVRERVLVETEEALRSDGVVRKRLSTIAQVMSRPINRRSDQSYTRIGLYNRGRGIFHKPAVPGTDLGESEFFSVCPGDLVISGQFAWEGAVALARAKESGCIASHRYPILRGCDGIASSAFLFSFFRSSYGAMLLDHHSRGAAGRNRPLNAQRLLKEEIPVLSRAVQERIESLLEQEYAVAQSVERMVRVINEYRTRLVADVVTGKLDVREAAARLPDIAPLETVEDDTELPDETEAADEEAAV